MPTAGGYYPQGQQIAYATTGTGGYTVAGGTLVRRLEASHELSCCAYLRCVLHRCNSPWARTANP